ncbi:MAG: hypothetical protein IJ867_04525 [Clostridia bacterium]|nr:hypothetical protein [Clostridia bacterium]
MLLKEDKLEKEIKYALEIFEKKELEEADLDRVSSVLISNWNVRGEELGVDISEISRLKNLKALELKGFELNQEIANILENFSGLEKICLYSCKSKEKVSVDFGKLKNILLDSCSEIDLNEIEMPENVKIVNCKVVDLSKLQNANQIKDLKIQASEIVNSSFLGKMKKLKKLNIDGSSLDDDEIIGKLRAKKVFVSNEFEYYPIK